MPNKVSKAVRSRIMAAIHSKNTKPELKLRKALRKLGLKGYRIHPKMMGNPDIVFSGKKIAIFVDGEFWHGYNWKRLGRVPPQKYWQRKINRNIARDKEINFQLKKTGWLVLRFWERQISKNSVFCVNKIKKHVKK